MCCKAGSPLKIMLNARVLGKDKGTPLLRNGIRSIAIEIDGDDDDDDDDGDDENDAGGDDGDDDDDNDDDNISE